MDNGRVSNIDQGRAKHMIKNFKGWILGVAACAFVGMGVQAVHADDYFDWLAEGFNGNVPTSPNYITTPGLNDSNVAQVVAWLTTQQGLGKALAVKVRAGVTLSPTTIAAVYGHFDIKYTFADYEGPTTVAMLSALVTQIKGSTVTGPAFNAGTAFVGNYAIAPIPSDPTHPTTGTTYTAGNSPVESYSNITDFRNSGVNMSNEELYPGDSSFRNPIYGNTPTGKGSNAPNILSSLFTLPIERLSFASQNLGAGQLHIPYISRFNNSDNASFSNTVVGGMAAFDTSGSSIGGQAVAGQLLSRNDFEALVLHYRMRGATSYQLLDPGVVGYTQAQEESDAEAGWTESLVAGVLGGTNGRAANLGTTITVDGTLKTVENAGVIWSAVTNDNATGPQLAVLVSNMDTTTGSHTVTFNTRINNATLSYTTGPLAGGSHTILRFDKVGGAWSLLDTDPVFNTGGSIMTSRDGVGIPEPASLSLIGLGMMGVLCRRRRNNA
jgi:hypothetical protein